MSTYRERREARAARLRGWAEAREAKSAASFGAARDLGDQIPFGQPILVGHHSEKRHRRDIERIDARMRAGVEHSRRAEKMTRWADSIERQLDSSIYSDDEDAADRLRGRIADLVAQRDRIKAYNASCRKGARDLSLLDEKQQQDILSIARHAAFQLGRNGEFPGYVLSNLGKRIKSDRDRLAKTERVSD